MDQQFDDNHLSLLRCVECGQRLKQRAICGETEWPRLQAELGNSCLECSNCTRKYPVTRDGIPILWTEELRACLVEELAANSPLSANVKVYDHISDDYAQYWRQEGLNARRMRAAANEAVGVASSPSRSGFTHDRPLRHLDVGCGPGHVMHWLSNLKAEQYGLDVSLSNLRNARQTTGAFVVLGSADRMPFADGVFDLVTESSVLHHIEFYERAVSEFARVCSPSGGVVIDSEPSRESKDWGWLACAVFRMRWYPYMLLSYVNRRKFWFRDLRTAKLTFERAEIHNRPNTGLSIEATVRLLESAGFTVRAVRSPNDRLEPRARMSWQEMLLHLLSGHNPTDPRYGWFSVIGRRGRLAADSSLDTATKVALHR